MSTEPQWAQEPIPTIEEMIAYLTREGWTKYRGNPLVWQSPSTLRLMRGPAAAYWHVKRQRDFETEANR